MWFFKDQNALPNDALRQNRRAALLISIGVVIIACTTLLNFPAYQILSAAPAMPDKIFAHSVVLVMPRGLARHGVILNHPLTPEQTTQLPPALQGHISDYGGPVNFPTSVAILAWRPATTSHPDDVTLTLLDGSALNASALQEKRNNLQAQGYRD